MKMRRFIFLTLASFASIGMIAAWSLSRQPVTIHASIAENGGFMPDHIKARVGEPLKLRLISDDVDHTFAIGQYPMEPALLKPGKDVNLTLTFDIPGTYTFYSITPSSMNFWRMRGEIEVIGAGEIQLSQPPLYVQLGLELDQKHASEEEHVGLTRQPSAARGALFESQIPSSYLVRDYYVAHSPMETYAELRRDSALNFLSENEIWDVVALIWEKNASLSAITKGQNLYQTNCAACHGETGAGDGQFANEMKAIAEKNKDEHGIQAPTDFSNAEHLLESKPAILQGLILRGGMGTGMPMWGSIFTEEQTWELIAYLYSFQFKYYK